MPQVINHSVVEQFVGACVRHGGSAADPAALRALLAAEGTGPAARGVVVGLLERGCLYCPEEGDGEGDEGGEA